MKLSIEDLKKLILSSLPIGNYGLDFIEEQDNFISIEYLGEYFDIIFNSFRNSIFYMIFV